MKKSKKTTSFKKRLNNTAILAFYKSRELKGDNSRLSYETGYSESHISNVKAGRRRVTTELANALYYISRRRVSQTVSQTAQSKMNAYLRRNSSFRLFLVKC